eukprot:TRINITY_DN1809_c0_g1_i1.p1 TRINITY_DN1809_c0_g1~~TRINITY_DN1809_c0_g1_i1.p1  ORF type:complete len:1299 (+),score=377.15 TRINITY_DN1809_c0_g1_i1:1796-5692(+)
MKTIFFFLLAFCTSTFAATCSVSLQEKGSVAAAINSFDSSCTDGFTIVLDNPAVYGTTGSTVTFDRGTTATGQSYSLILTPPTPSTSSIPLTIQGFDKVTLRGLTFTNLASSITVVTTSETNAVSIETVSITSTNTNKRKGLVVTGPGSTRVSGSTFTSLRNGDNGGCIQTVGPITFDASDALNKISKCSTPSNKAGGAVYSKDVVTIIGGSGATKRNLFDDNSATNGAHIYSVKSVTVSGTNTFSNGDASTNGGAIYATTEFTISGSTYTNTFDTNTANGLGGSVYAGANILVEGAISASKGRAEKGGVFYSANGNIELKGSSQKYFSSNVATRIVFTPPYLVGSGGSIYASTGAVILDGTGSNNKFSSSRATIDGGAIWSKGDVTFVSGSSFTFEKGTTANNGGAIYSMGTVAIDGTTRFDSNAAEKGGAVYSETSVTTTAAASQFAIFNKNAAVWGAAIYSKGTVTIKTSKFTENLGNVGGAVYSKATATLTDSTFTSNAVLTLPLWNEIKNGKGGALFTEAGFTATRCDFTLNSATEEGSVASYSNVNGFSSSFTACTFSQNHKNGVKSIVVPDGSQLVLSQGATATRAVTPAAWSYTDIWISSSSTVKTGGIQVDVQCLDQSTPNGKTYPTVVPTTNQNGVVSCNAIDSTKVSTLGFSVSFTGTKNRYDLKDAIVAQSKSTLSNSYVIWKFTKATVSQGVTTFTYFVQIVFFGTPTDTYHNVYDTQVVGTAKRAPNALNTAGFTPNFSGSTMTFATQDKDVPECAKDDPNACDNSGYCVQYASTPGSTGNYVGYCSCMSGYEKAQCTVFKNPDTTPIQTSYASFEPELSLQIADTVKFFVKLPADPNAKTAGATSFSTTTFLKMKNADPTITDCDYPKRQDATKGWIHTTEEVGNKWFDKYYAEFTYVQLQKCGLQRVDIPSDPLAMFNNTLTIERDYEIHNGRFSISRTSKEEHQFSVDFPKTVSSSSSIRVKNNTIEFFLSVSEISYSHTTDKWTLKLATIVANDYKLNSTFVGDGPFGTVAAGTNRGFALKTRTPLEACLNEICTQEFEFTWTGCLASSIPNMTLEFMVSCHTTTDCANPAVDKQEAFLTINTQDACPQSREYDINDEALYFYATEADITTATTQKKLFGSSETMFMAVNYTLPPGITQTSEVVAICAYIQSEVVTPLVPCKPERSVSLSGKLSAEKGSHQIAFSINAGDVKAASQQNGNSIYVQVDLKLTYGSTIQKKSISYVGKSHSAISNAVITDRLVEENSVLREEEKQNEENHYASSSTLLSVSIALIVGMMLMV